MQGLLIITLFLGLLFLLLLLLSVSRLKRKRWIASVGWGGQSVIVLLMFLLGLMVYSNLHTYQRLTHESVLADVYLRKIKQQQFQLSLEFPGEFEEQHYYLMKGDQWQLDARILKWKSWANLIGLDSHFQLERLSGRYQDIEQARQQIPSIHDLKQAPRGLDLWRLKQLFQDKLFFMDAFFGQSVYMPMLDGAHYQISLGQAGLIVRPMNDAAQAAIF